MRVFKECAYPVSSLVYCQLCHQVPTKIMTQNEYSIWDKVHVQVWSRVWEQIWHQVSYVNNERLKID
jgi:hypothetical protein